MLSMSLVLSQVVLLVISVRLSPNECRDVIGKAAVVEIVSNSQKRQVAL